MSLTKAINCVPRGNFLSDILLQHQRSIITYDFPYQVTSLAPRDTLGMPAVIVIIWGQTGGQTRGQTRGTTEVSLPGDYKASGEYHKPPES